MNTYCKTHLTKKLSLLQPIVIEPFVLHLHDDQHQASIIMAHYTTRKTANVHG